MILYHSSYMEITQPDLKRSRAANDFGRGFYTTPIYDQAVKGCAKLKRCGKDGIVSRYEFDENGFKELKVLKFESYSEEWLDFIQVCRSGKDSTDYDIVVGSVIHNNLFNTTELYFQKLIDKSEAIHRFHDEKPNLKICFRSERALKEYLRFEGSEVV